MDTLHHYNNKQQPTKPTKIFKNLISTTAHTTTTNFLYYIKIKNEK